MSDVNPVKLSKRKTKLVGPPGFLGGFPLNPGPPARLGMLRVCLVRLMRPRAWASYR